MVILLIIAVIFLVLVAGFLLAFLFSRLDRTVATTRAEMAAEERAYNPGLTLGHKIKVASDYDEQMKQARLQAAKTAAALPRGANNRVGRLGQSNLSTAGKSAADDPMTAVRIARFHGWDGARTGIPAGGIPAGGVAPAVAAAPAAAGSVAPAAAGIAPPRLITITPDMPPEEVRKARVANAKAESAYNKALKAAASGATVAATVAAPLAGVVPPAAPAAAPIAAIAPPTLIEITPGMPPEEVRKARVANAKAEAAYNKALKAAGATMGPVGAPAVAQPVAAPAQPVAAAPAPTAPAAAAGIAPPQLIEITDSMPPEEIRRARVANAKAESAYNKALKAAGIDPAALKGGAPVAPTASVTAAPVPESAAPVAEPMAAAPAPAGAMASSPAAAAGIAPPQLIEITADMAPDEVRQARVANAKASAAYNKALKAAGIDPASLK